MITIYADLSIADRWEYPVGGVPADPRIQPYLTRLAWIIDDGVSDPLAEKCHLIEIPAVLGGGGRISLREAMMDFLTDLGVAGMLVTYNWSHTRLVLEHAISYRLSWPLPVWPHPESAMWAAGQLAKHAREANNRTHHMTDATVARRRNWFIAFEVAAAAAGVPLSLEPTLDPISAGYQRAWAIRKIWTDYENL